VPYPYDEVLRLWDLEGNKELLRLEGHLTSLTSVIFHPAGNHALSAGNDFTVRLWRLKGGPPSPKPPAPRVVWKHDATLDEFTTWTRQCDAAGYLPIWAQGHATEGSRRFTGIATRITQVNPWLISPMHRGQVQQTLRDFRAQGGQLLTLTGLTDSGAEGYIACFSRGDYPTREPLLGVLPADFPREKERLREQKQRPFSLTGAANGDAGVLTMLYGPDDGKTPWEAWQELTEKEYEATLKEWRAKGYRPLSASAYPTKDGLRNTLLLVKDEVTEWAAEHDLTAEKFGEAARGWDAKGYRPLVIVGYLAEKESRYLGVWVKDELAKPIGPPPKGS
jgi:hypothetical protein